MPYRYPPEFRRKVLDLLAAGRSVASLSADRQHVGPDDLQQLAVTRRANELLKAQVVSPKDDTKRSKS